MYGGLHFVGSLGSSWDGSYVFFFFNSPGGLGGQNLKRAVAEVATVELIA